MLPISKCVFCKGNILEQTVTEIIKGGGNTATLKVSALVCQNCGERYYDADTIREFERIKTKLTMEKTDDLTIIGKSFEVV
jgi:YgiT-type zinc finger domain-containing protein